MILLGVGTAVPDVDRENTHMVWDGPGGPLLIDAGGSTYQRLLKAGIEPRELQGVFLTHSHADHINGFPVLLFSLALVGRQEPLTVYGLEETLALVRPLVEAFQLEQYALPVNWHPVAAGDTIPLATDNPDTWLLRTALTKHARPCLGLRFENQSSDTALVYSCDTAPCPAIAELAQGAHTLIHEATTSEPSETHTTPHQAGEIALEAGVERLVLVHYSPRWTMPEMQALAEIRASGFAGIAEIGRENQVLELIT
jgi:ribonuclease Z